MYSSLWKLRYKHCMKKAVSDIGILTENFRNLEDSVWFPRGFRSETRCFRNGNPTEIWWFCGFRKQSLDWNFKIQPVSAERKLVWNVKIQPVSAEQKPAWNFKILYGICRQKTTWKLMVQSVAAGWHPTLKLQIHHIWSIWELMHEFFLLLNHTQ